MVSLAEVWRSYGVEPAAVVGHSQGEIAAAVVAGALSLEDGARVVALRSRAILALSGQGGMASVQLSVDEVQGWSPLVDGRVEIAAVNGPSSVVVAGSPEGLDEVIAEAEARGARARRIEVDYASHTAHVERLGEEIPAVLAAVTPVPSSVPFHSTVTADRFDTTGLDAEYWYRNLRSTVRLDDTVAGLVEAGHRVFVEISPHPVLAGAVQATAEAAGREVAVTGTLRRGEGGPQRLLLSLGEAYAQGVPVDWRACFTATAIPSEANAAAKPEAPAEAKSEATAEAAREAEAEPGPETGNGSRTRHVDLPTYAFQHKRYWPETLSAGGGGAGRAVDDWRYRVVWRRSALAEEARLSGRWLLLTPEDPEGRPGEGTYDRIAMALREAGADVVSAAEAGSADVAGDWAGVLASPASLGDAVTLLRDLRAAGLEAPLWWLTEGAVAAVADDTVRPDAAQLWGLGQVVGLEHPDRWGGLVDLPTRWTEDTGQRLAAVLAAADDETRAEDQVAVRESGVRVRRLVRAVAGGRGPGHLWTPRGTVLVTGGTGGIGAHVARRLAAEGTDHLVLTSRRGARAPGAADLGRELEALGARVTFAACDVADRDALAAVLAGIPDEAPLTAVVHAAGVATFSDVLCIEADELVAGTAAKVRGARNLDELTAGLDLDAFVLFSSGAAVWGSAGNGTYAAANAYLDGLAHERRARGLTATSVAWGGWAGGGMLQGSEAVAGQLERMGLRQMQPELAIDVLWEAVSHGETTLTVSDMDWERFAPVYALARRRPLIEEIPETARALSGKDPAGDEPVGDADTGVRLRERLTGLTDLERHDTLVELVREHAAAVLGHASPEALTPDRPFKDLGFDSLTATELRNRLNAATGLRLPATLVFDHPTPLALAELLHRELHGGTDPAADRTVVVRRADHDEPLAIVGMACRLPGGVTSPEDLWRLVVEGRDEIAAAPDDRGWDRWGTTDGLRGGFLRDIGGFDAEFFGVSPREALAMDPQQRMLLEVAWEAIERSGIDPSSLRSTRTGVFVGGSPTGYGALLGDAPDAGGYLLTGNSGSVMSGRIAYVLGLEGPALTVDTACSSSLVSLHLAGQALRGGECDLALTGGVAVMPTPGAFDEFARQGGLAPDGRCKAFADTADGTGWSEGIAFLVVERLSDARRNGHPVLATVRGSATNQDGASNGLSAPNGPAQQRVIRAALADAGLAPSDVDAVEAHGTGTRLGDPIEAQALLAAYGQNRERPLYVGSLKSNIGHTQAVSGVAGVIKTVLALRHGVLPKTLHVGEPSREVDWSAGAVELLTEQRRWPDSGDRPRRAAVSSFGISGTNAHVVLEQAPEPDVTSEPVPASCRGPVPWTLSGHTEDALRAQATFLIDHLTEHQTLPVDSVAHTLALSRAALEHRAVVVGAEHAELLRGVKAVAEGRPDAGVVRGRAGGGGSGGSQGPVFVFPGQGSQWAGMAVELLESSPVFAARMAECERALSAFVDWSLTEALRVGDELTRVDVVQPVLWAVMVS
ncbi:type I polyketide synthase, partial [Streptomyces caniscabiei]|uniref:type I polyketide synthase n=1 Tax=Streptomyces caniscabiei TaxID=2746961 RepID=UPI00117ED007